VYSPVQRYKEIARIGTKGTKPLKSQKPVVNLSKQPKHLDYVS
jgi:hypothetical protein